MKPPDEKRDMLLKESHSLGHIGSQPIVKDLHSQGIHWANIYEEAKNVVSSYHKCRKHNIIKYTSILIIAQYVTGGKKDSVKMKVDTMKHLTDKMSFPVSIVSSKRQLVAVLDDRADRHNSQTWLP
ncbi:hypothetical protein BDB01DRAFT_789580 [Pilobolus umbonatus]|nr:hypothetical protein BDB01DRAFT_789580 [Pilobolus umbonatus]